jgi:alanine-glyoxylate transaminase/serine-glyoxylate transaminase/serine-pyruvate transaminase
MLLGAISGAEMAMLDVGVKIEPGSGTAAAQNYWRSHSQVAAAKDTAARSIAA